MLTVKDKTKEQLTSELARLHQRVAELEASAAECKQAEEAPERTAKDLHLVNLVNNAANRGYSLQRILQLVTHGTKRIFSCYEATFYQISEDKKYLIVQKLNLPKIAVSQIEKLIGMKVPTVRIRLQEGSLYLKALQADKPQIINDPETVQGLMAECTENKLLKKLVPGIYKLLDIRSVMQAPLVSEGEVIGMLDISRKEPFTELELEQFTTIAQQLLIIIKRKMAEETIHQQNEFLGNVLDSLTHPFYVIDVNNYTVKMANPAARVGNLSENPTCYALTHKKAKPCGDSGHVCPLVQVKKTRKPAIAEHIHYDEDGNARNIEVHGYPIFDTEGNVAQMIEYSLDITERKQAEQALADEATRRHILVNQSLDGIVVLDENSKVYEANQRFAEMLGYTPEEVRELHTWDWDIQWSREELLEMGRKVDETGYHLETYHRRKDGTIIDVEISVNGAVCAGQKLIFCVCRDITERKRVEEALQAEKNKLQSVIDALVDGLSIQDKDYNIIYQSESTRIIFGDHVGEKCYQVYEGRDKICDGCPVEKAFRDGKSHTTERKVVTPSGETIFENTTNPIRNASGEIVACLEVGRNITEHKQVEKALKESEEKYKELAESITDVFFAFDKDLRYTYWNKASEELTGISAKDALGKHLYDIFSNSELTRRAEKVYLKALRTQQVQSFVNEYQLGDKNYFFEISAYPSKNGLSVFTRDITERKKAEEALRESQKFSSSLLTNSPIPIVVINQDTSVRYVNPALEKLTGFSSAEVIGRKAPYPWWTEETIKKTGKDLEQAMHKGAVRLEELFQKKNSERFWVEITSTPVISNGEFKHYMANWVDITERKQAEEREKELQQELLLSSRLASIGELAAGVAHQINNPLTGVLGFSQRLLRKSTNQKVSQDLKKICTEAERAAKVVQNLLTFARRRQPNKQYSDINEILQSALELRTYELKTSNIEVITDLAPTLPQTMLDFHQIQEVFLNIILNAEQVMTEANNGGKLTIRTEERKGYIRTTFTDDGPGIPVEHLDKIFVPFFSTKGEKGGTGLGLSVCHGIITEHGGKIYAKSKPGKGATFFIELPLPVNASQEIAIPSREQVVPKMG